MPSIIDNRRMRTVAGMDGCRAGWFVVRRDASGAVDLAVFSAFPDAVAALSDCAAIGVDIPIGLPDRGARACDVLARQRLSPQRAASVFPAPIRPILDCADYVEACDRRERIEGKRMSKQAYNIVPKIIDVDEVLQKDSALASRIYEVHPELAFSALAGRPLSHPKRTPNGIAERQALLENHGGPLVLDEALARWPRSEVARDDVLDAVAVMLAADRIAAGEGRRLPAEPISDSTGLDMAIWF